MAEAAVPLSNLDALPIGYKNPSKSKQLKLIGTGQIGSSYRTTNVGDAIGNFISENFPNIGETSFSLPQTIAHSGQNNPEEIQIHKLMYKQFATSKQFKDYHNHNTF